MQNYKTVKDKATEWNLSSRHVQYLCRNGRIKGAIKRSDVWFIPANAPSPATKTKLGDGDFNFVGTKKKIFYSAIEQFKTKGYDSVSLRDIAAEVGVRQSTIYNHFKSKQEILDVIYDFYSHYYLKDRPSIEQMKVKLQKESLNEIIRSIRYLFSEEYIQELLDITKIIFQRVSVDSRARDIARHLMMEEGVGYVESVFDMGIALGRFAPFDTHTLAIFINSVRVYTLYNWIIDQSPAILDNVLEDEQMLYNYATQLMQGVTLNQKTKKP